MGVRNKPVWQVAAETVAGGSDSGAVEARALTHHAEPLRQYLSVRLGSEEEGREALATLRARVKQLPRGELLAEPGARARLFAMARELAGERREDARPTRPDGPAPRLQTLNWHKQDARDAAVRDGLPDGDRELLELHHARDLDDEELSFVMGTNPGHVRERLDAARTQAARLVAANGEAELADTVAAAFELAPDPLAPGEEHPALPAGTCINERYVLEQRVGVGAFGQVYRASDSAVPGHVVALKWLHASANSEAAREAALRELRIIASVFHPSVVHFKDHGWHEGRLWFVMPWYEGETLEERIEREPLTRQEALRIFVPLANALATMHAAGVRHQDIKPDNIFLTRLETRALAEDQLHPVLLDLGVAAKEAEMLVAGTPSYFAPEVAAQYRGAHEQAPKVSNRADTFSLALTLRNALEPDTRERVTSSTLDAFIERRATQLPPLPGGEDLRYLRPHFERWMSLTPELRPSAEALAQELRVLEEPERKRAARRAMLRWLAPLAASFLVLIVAVWVFLSHQAAVARSEARHARATAQTESQKRRVAERGQQELQLGLQQKRAETRALSTALSSAEQKRETLTDSLSSLERREIRLRQAVEERETALEASKVLTESLEQRGGELQASLAAAKAEARARADRVAALSADLALARVESNELQSDLDEAQTRLEAVQRELDGVTEKQRTTARELRAARKRVVELEREARASPQPPAAAPEPPTEATPVP